MTEKRFKLKWEDNDLFKTPNLPINLKEDMKHTEELKWIKQYTWKNTSK